MSESNLEFDLSASVFLMLKQNVYISCSVCRNVMLAESNQDEIAWFHHAIQYLGANVYVFMFRSSYPDFSVRVLGSSDQ